MKFIGVVMALLCACDTGAQVIPTFETTRVLAHVEKQCRWGPRVPNSPAHDSVMVFLEETMKSYGADVSLQSFDTADPYGDRTLHLVNVVAKFAPKRSKRVMLAAHYDSRPRSDRETVDSLRALPVPGAVDGATGVGVLLEIGRMLGEEMPGGIGVDLVYFDGEDYGREGDLDYYLLGAKYFAANLNGHLPRSVILLDMVGGQSTLIAREAYSQTNSAELTDELFRRAAALGLDYFVDLSGPPVYDDHVPLIQAGLTAVDLFGYEYPHWHTTRDTPDKCDPEKLAQVGALLTDFLYDYPY